MISAESQSYLVDLVKREDKDRYLTTLFAPAEFRDSLIALYAFNVEVSRVREVTSESLIGQMKLEWWRGVLASIYEGGSPPQGNPVVEGLRHVIETHELSRIHFDELLNARADDMNEDAPPDLLALETYAEGTSARLLWLALEILGVESESSKSAARHVGIAWSLTGLMRAVLFHAQVNKMMLPQDLMNAKDLNTQDAFRQKNAEKISEVVREIVDVAKLHLDKAKSIHADVDSRAIPALLVGVLATQYLRGAERRRFDVFDPKYALQRPSILNLTWSAWRGRYY